MAKNDDYFNSDAALIMKTANKKFNSHILEVLFLSITTAGLCFLFLSFSSDFFPPKNKVSAATFDASLLPVANQPSLGIDLGGATSNQMWRSINDVIYFPFSGDTYTNNIYFGNTGNVGIGTTNPSSKLHVAGDTLISTDSFGSGGHLVILSGFRAGTNSDTCADSTRRGFIRFVQGVAGASDEVQICMYDQSSGYQWKKIINTQASALPMAM